MAHVNDTGKEECPEVGENSPTVPEIEESVVEPVDMETPANSSDTPTETVIALATGICTLDEYSDEDPFLSSSPSVNTGPLSAPGGVIVQRISLREKLLFPPGDDPNDSKESQAEQTISGQFDSDGFSSTSEDKEAKEARNEAIFKAYGCHPPFINSYEWFKERYPEVLNFPCFSPPLVVGRAFSVSQLDQIDDTVLQNYRDVSPECVPIPAGFWEEMGRVDSSLNTNYQLLEKSLPNEEWIMRRLQEGCPIPVILDRLWAVLVEETHRADAYLKRKIKFLKFLKRVTLNENDKVYLGLLLEDVQSSIDKILNQWLYRESCSMVQQLTGKDLPKCTWHQGNTDIKHFFVKCVTDFLKENGIKV